MQVRSMPASTETMVGPERRNKKEIDRRAESKNVFVNITVKKAEKQEGGRQTQLEERQERMMVALAVGHVDILQQLSVRNVMQAWVCVV